MLGRKQLTDKCIYNPRNGIVSWYDSNQHPSCYSQQHISNVLLDQFTSIATEQHFEYLIQQLKQHPTGPHGKHGEDNNPLHAKRVADLAWKRKKKDMYNELCYDYAISDNRKDFGNDGFWRWVEKYHYNQYRILTNKTKVAQNKKRPYNKRVSRKKTFNRKRYK